LVVLMLLAAAGPASANHLGCGLLGLAKCPHPAPAGPPAPAPPDVAPEPAGDENAAVPTPPPGGKLVGFNSGLSADSAWDPAAEYGLAKTAGANAHRLGVSWLEAEPSPPVGGQRTYSEAYLGRLDQRYAAMRALGITPLLVLQSAPRWAQPRTSLGLPVCPDCTSYVEPDDRHIGDWHWFARMVAQRYPEAAYEIWNEPNQKWAYKPAPNPQRYERLFAVAYNGIKAENPAAAVVVGGVAGAGTTNNFQIETGEFIRKLYLHGIKHHAPDFRLGLHLYPGGYQLGEGSGWAQGWNNALKPLRENGDATREVWMTESGMSTTPEPQAATPAQQADILRRQYNRLMTMDSYGPADRRVNVRAVIFHTLKDDERSPLSSHEYGFGFLRHSPWLQPKPVYCWMVGNEAPGAPVRSYSGC
jgi:hypothetical protein